jgi:hypothetical protein
VGFNPEERHTNRRGTPTLVDLVFGRAVASDADDSQDRATVSLTVDYLKPAMPGSGSRRTRESSASGARSLSPTARCGSETARSCAPRAVFAAAG